jgi:hypothetical protein
MHTGDMKGALQVIACCFPTVLSQLLVPLLLMPLPLLLSAETTAAVTTGMH